MPRELLLSTLVSCALVIGCGDDGSGTGSGSSGSSDSGSTSTTPTTTNMTTTNMTTTGESSSTTMADSTTTMDPDSSTGPTTTDAESSSSSGGGEDAAYPPCTLDEDPVCPRPYDECYDFAPEHNGCTAPCAEPDDCPVPASGDAVVVCAGQNLDQCLLDCANGETCPDGMECVDVTGNGMFLRCLWPNP